MPTTVESPLSAVEFLAAQYQPIHSTRGTFYMSTNTAASAVVAAAAAILYVRNAESNAVRQLTPEQAARCHESPVGSNNYIDAAGVITGTIFSGVAEGAVVELYSRAYDRWYDPNAIGGMATADEFFASQQLKSFIEPAQWWTDPAPAAASSTPAATTEQPAAVTQIIQEPEAQSSSAAVPAAPAGPATPVVAHAGHVSVLEQIAAKIRHGEQVFVHEIEAALHAVEKAL